MQSGQLRIFDPVTSQYTDVGPNNPNYNSIGYSTADNLIYGQHGANVVRIDANGTMTTLFNAGFRSFIGDMDGNNNLYVRVNNNSTQLRQINVVTQTITNITLSQGTPNGVADWAFVDTPQGAD